MPFRRRSDQVFDRFLKEDGDPELRYIANGNCEFAVAICLTIPFCYSLS